MDRPLDFNRNTGQSTMARASKSDSPQQIDMVLDDRNDESSTTGGAMMGVSNRGGSSMMKGPMMGGKNMGGGFNMGGSNVGGGTMMSGPNMGGPNMSGSNMGGPNMGGGQMMNSGGGQMMNNGPMNMMNNGQMYMGPGMMSGAMSMGGYNMGTDYDFMMGDPFVMGGAPLEVDGRETLHFNGFILVPPPPHAPPRSAREKPPGCKTVFIGGLPETVTEDMIGELMQTCGNIDSIRLGKKYFAHVRFDSYEAVDKAIFYSGWRMKIGEKDDKPNTGRIHCDYATARDDQHEYENMQRAMERERRHQQRMIEDMNRPPSPPQVVRYSETEASNVTEMLKNSQGFGEAAKILMEWLDKGYVSTRNANRFYSMMHSVSSSLRRISGEKENMEQELLNHKAQYTAGVATLLSQMEQVHTVFTKAKQQKVWDHLSRPQRKNIDLWIKQCQELKQKQDDEMMAEREEAEMDLSDTESSMPLAKKARLWAGGEVNSLKDENDSLNCQLEAYKNELDMNKQDSLASLEQKGKQIAMLQQTLKGMQEQLMSTRNLATQLQKKCDELKPSGEALKTLSQDTEAGDEVPEIIQVAGGDTILATDKVGEEISIKPPVSTPSAATAPVEPGSVDAGSARLLGLVVCFLHVHPFGASIDYIWSYLQRGGLETKSSQIESLLESFPSMFCQKMHGIGVNFEKRWTFIGFPSTGLT